MKVHLVSKLVSAMLGRVKVCAWQLQPTKVLEGPFSLFLGHLLVRRSLPGDAVA